VHSPTQSAPSCEIDIQDQKKELTSDGDKCADKEESLSSAYLDGVQTISDIKEEPAFKNWSKCEHFAVFTDIKPHLNVVLATPVTQVSIERAFLSLHYILIERRSSLSAETLNSLLVVKLNSEQVINLMFRFN